MIVFLSCSIFGFGCSIFGFGCSIFGGFGCSFFCFPSPYSLLLRLIVPQVFLHEEHVVIGLSEIEYIFNETEKRGFLSWVYCILISTRQGIYTFIFVYTQKDINQLF